MNSKGDSMKRLVPLVLLLLMATGCRARLNSESNVKVDLMDKHSTTVDPISREQKINVTATPTKGQYSIYLFLEKDKAAVEKEIDQNKEPAKALDKALKTDKTANLSAQIPANERAVVLIMSGDGQKVEVKLKITN